MKILVTGCGGYIGTALTERLLNLGHFVVGVDRYFFGAELLGEDILNHPKFQLVRADIRSVETSLFEGVDAVIDLAGLSNDPSCDLDLELTDKINYQGSVHVATSAKEAGVSKYIYSSSCSVYGHGDDLQLTEESPLAPVSAYAQSKVACERDALALADDSFTVTLLRNATVYGISRRMRFDLIINIMTLYAWRDSKVFVMGGDRQWRPLVHVQDVCSAFIAVLDADPSVVQREVYNVGSNGQNYQVVQVANIIKGALPDTEIIVVPDDPDKRTYNVAFDKITERLDYRTEKTPIDGILEIAQALDTGQLQSDDPRGNTVGYYKYLIDAERRIKEIAIDGAIF